MVTLYVAYPTDYVREDLGRWMVSAIQSNIDSIVVSVDNWEVIPHVCPGLECPDAWHTDGCGPYWTYSLDGFALDGGLYDEDDADERRLWEGPDGPSKIEYKRNGRWEEA